MSPGLWDAIHPGVKVEPGVRAEFTASRLGSPTRRGRPRRTVQGQLPRGPDDHEGVGDEDVSDWGCSIRPPTASAAHCWSAMTGNTPPETGDDVHV